MGWELAIAIAQRVGVWRYVIPWTIAPIPGFKVPGWGGFTAFWRPDLLTVTNFAVPLLRFGFVFRAGADCLVWMSAACVFVPWAFVMMQSMVMVHLLLIAA